MNAHVRRFGDQLVVAFDQADEARLALAEGEALAVDIRDGVVVLSRSEGVTDDRLSRGKAFIDRYRETFEALAK